MKYDNTNKGAIFRNKNKATEKHPDFKGIINVGGREYYLSAWKKIKGPNTENPGEKFISLAVTPKDESELIEYNTKKAGFDDFDDDIPF